MGLIYEDLTAKKGDGADADSQRSRSSTTARNVDPAFAPPAHNADGSNESMENFYDRVRRYEISLIREALDDCDGDRPAAAIRLGIKRSTLDSMIKRYEIDPNE